MTVELLKLLLLIVIANGAPIVARVLLNNGFKLAVDFGQTLTNNNPVFGSSKTWRGIFAALTATAIAALFLGYPPETGLLVATYCVLGDLLSSFVKRRLSMKESSMALFLDQIPESLLPALMMMDTFNLDIISVAILVLAFVVIELVLSQILYKWGMRNRPY